MSAEHDKSRCLLHRNVQECMSARLKQNTAAMAGEPSQLRDLIRQCIDISHDGSPFLLHSGLDEVWNFMISRRTPKNRVTFDQFVSTTAVRFQISRSSSSSGAEAEAQYHPNVLLLLFYDFGFPVRASDWESLLQTCPRLAVFRNTSTSDVSSQVGSASGSTTDYAETSSMEDLEPAALLQLDAGSRSADSGRSGTARPARRLRMQSVKPTAAVNAGSVVENADDQHQQPSRKIHVRQLQQIQKLKCAKRSLQQQLRRQKEQSKRREAALRHRIQELQTKNDFDIQTCHAVGESRKWSWLTPAGIVNVGAPCKQARYDFWFEYLVALSSYRTEIRWIFK